MIRKVPSAISTALLAAFLSGNAAAVTGQEAHAQLDRTPAKTADARQTAHAVLNDLMSAGVPVDQAYEVVRSSIEHNYSATELRQVGDEVREQVRQGIPAAQVTQTADLAIDANYSAAATQKVLDTFQAQVEKGMSADQAYARSASEIGTGTGRGTGSDATRSGTGTGSSNTAQTGTGTGTGSQAERFGAGMTGTTGMGGSAGMGGR